MKTASLIGLVALCFLSSCIRTSFPIPKPPSGGGSPSSPGTPGTPGQTSYSLQWQKTLSGGQILGIVQTSDGGFVGTGNSNHDAWIFKLDAARNVVWEKTLGNPGYQEDMGWSIVATSDGGFVVAGYTQNLTSGYPSDLDGFVFKVDANGNILWQHAYGSGGTDQFFSIAATADGGFLAGGYTNGGDRDITGVHGSYDFWLVKLDASGNKVWSKAIGGSSEEGPGYVRATADGGFMLAGTSNSADGDIPANNGYGDFVAIKLDANGNKVWAKNYGGPGQEDLNNIITTPDGGFLLMGSSDTQGGDVTGVIKGVDDAWMVKIDANGVKQWQRTAGGTDREDMWCGVAASDGGYMLAGETFSSDGDITQLKGGRDFWVIKLDGSGNLAWQKTFGGTAEDGAEGLISTADGGFVVSGFVNAINGDASGTGGGAWMFEIK